MHKDPYTASIRAISLRLPKLQDNDKEVKKLKTERLSRLGLTFFADQDIDFFGVIGGLFISQSLFTTHF